MTEPSYKGVPTVPIPREGTQIPPVSPQMRQNAQTQTQPRVQGKRTSGNGRLVISGKRFFGQFLIDHWILRINGEQKKAAFGQNKLTMELPAGVYTVKAYTPYLGMHCMRAAADIEIHAGHTTRVIYETVFDIFKDGVLRKEGASR